MGNTLHAQPGLTYAEIKALDPCADSLRRVTKLLGGARKWKHKITAAEAVAAGATYADIMWAATCVARRDQDVARRVRLWLADCAAHVLHIYEMAHAGDDRPRNAIIATRKFARGEISDDTQAAARDAAGAAAWDASRAAARDAAKTAACTAAWDAARAAAWDAAWAAAVAAAWDAEEAWQLDRLVAWLSESEPEDYPLPIREATNA